MSRGRAPRLRVLSFPQKKDVPSQAPPSATMRDWTDQRVAAFLFGCSELVRTNPGAFAYVEALVERLLQIQRPPGNLAPQSKSTPRNIGKPVIDLTGDDREGA